jgi:hypothetical protein
MFEQFEADISLMGNLLIVSKQITASFHWYFETYQTDRLAYKLIKIVGLM